MIKLVVLLLLCFSSISCAGIAVGSFGTFESKSVFYTLKKEKNEFGFKSTNKRYSKNELIKLWGNPDSISIDGECEILTYYDGYSWSGVGVFFIIIPLPLLVPSGYDENKFYFKDGESVGLIKEYGEVVSTYGYMCGSNDCGFIAGKVNEDKERKVSIDWCSK